MPDERAPDKLAACSLCRAFAQAPPDADHDGWCHLNPPTIITIAPNAGEAKWNPQSFWPEVMNDDWCLKFDAR
jgi:hypothetical protein